MQKISLKNKDNNLLKMNFQKALLDENFKELVDSIDLENDILMKWTTKLLDASKEANNCKTCQSLLACQNSVKGYCWTPCILNNSLNFSYIECKKKQEMDLKNKYLQNVYYYEIPSSLKGASLKNVYKDDSKRTEIIKKIKDFYDKYKKGEYSKGIYVAGNFGSGKSYIIAALFNELAKYNFKSSIIYFPEFLRKLKSNFGESNDELFENIKKIPLLAIDDIGAEKLTDWARDEILGSILQYRMDFKLPTFFTSNLNLQELENHLQITNSKADKVKARRIMERIIYLTDEVILLGVNRRNK